MNGQQNRGGKSWQGGNRNPNNSAGGYGGKGPSIEKITAPYNFVPLSKKVFFPDWADKVSHDVPFADGISGELECELTTHTPIYVRNGGKWEPAEIMKEGSEAQMFFYVREGEKRHFMIPGTSLKGMLRNVVEIASFGKMCRVDDHRYGIRDLTSTARRIYGSKMTVTRGGAYEPQAKAGWLVGSEDGDWSIIPCEFARVDHKLLIQEYGADPKIKIREHAFTAKGKYDLLPKGLDNLQVKFEATAKIPQPHGNGKQLIYRKVTSLKNGQSGTLVVTGQPSDNNGANGRKHMEFVFFDEHPSNRLKLSKRATEDFEFIHSDANRKPNDDWGMWKPRLFNGKRVPVFYLLRPDGSVHSFGLALMYRLPYEYSVDQAIVNTSPDHSNPDQDLAETIFGYVNGNESALKGRISISPAVALNPAQGKVERTVLGGPKASYYPNYIEQPENLSNGKLDHKTFMDKGCNIRGWKRYPVRELNKVKVPDGVGDNVDTCLIPLSEGVRFVFSVKVHNLKPAELGALVWALTWGGNPKLRHSLGMGKSMGFGVADIKIKSASLRDMADASVDWQNCMKVFVELMDREVGGAWLKTAQMEQLLAMADPSIKPQCGELKHMDLANKNFQDAKTGRLRLEPHIKPSAIADETRFKNLRPRSQKPTNAPGAPPAAAVQAPQTVLTSNDETWPQVRLSFNRGPRILQAQAKDGKRAEVQLTGSFAKLVSEDVLNTIPKGKTIVADVTVEKLGNKWRIIAVKPV